MAAHPFHLALSDRLIWLRAVPFLAGETRRPTCAADVRTAEAPPQSVLAKSCRRAGRDQGRTDSALPGAVGSGGGAAGGGSGAA